MTADAASLDVFPPTTFAVENLSTAASTKTTCYSTTP